MYSERQQQILREVTRGLGVTEPGDSAVTVEQSPGYVDSVIETADFAVAALGAIGSTVATIGERRGLGPSRVHRPTALSAAFQRGCIFFRAVGSSISDPSSRRSAYRCATTARSSSTVYQHLRDGILRFRIAQGPYRIARRVAQFDAQALEDELPLWLCAIKRSPEDGLHTRSACRCAADRDR
jgi:hypothetical protein